MSIAGIQKLFLKLLKKKTIFSKRRDAFLYMFIRISEKKNPEEWDGWENSLKAHLYGFFLLGSHVLFVSGGDLAQTSTPLLLQAGQFCLTRRQQLREGTYSELGAEFVNIKAVCKQGILNYYSGRHKHLLDKNSL